MMQWITALEKVSAASHYVGRNRFDSFAPIRMNVAAQWLVDGVRGSVHSVTSSYSRVCKARLLLELISSDSARTRNNLYPRLVAVSW